MTKQRELTGVQHRAFAFDEVEVRAVDGGDGFTFEGVASIVDKPYTATDMFGSFTETIHRGAFDKTLSELKARSKKGGVGSDVGLFINHDYKAAPLATVSAGTLELWADPHLRVRAKLNPARPSVQEIRHAVNDGDMRQMSIGFNVPKGRSEWDDDGHHVRETVLVEASVVWLGDNHMTTAGMRSISDLVAGVPDMTPDEWRSLVARLETRFADIYSDDVRGRLRAALLDRYQPHSSQWIWVRDFTDNDVVFEKEGFSDAGCFRLAYALEDGAVRLVDGDPVPVIATTSYAPARPTGGARAELLELWARRRPA